MRLLIAVGLTRVDPAAYSGWDGNCPGADRDAARFAALCHDAGFDGITLLVDQAATRGAVQAAFLRASHYLRADDLLVLYASGHGGQQRDRDGDEADGKDETLLWYDGQVTDDVIGAHLLTLPKRVRVLTVSDTCNSGSNFRGQPQPAKLPRKKAEQRFAGSLLHFAGCADGKASFGSQAGGQWTNTLVATIARARKPVTYHEWFQRSARMMPENQRPVLTAWGGAKFADRPALT